MKSLIVHLKNKYPGAQIQSTETSIDVFQNGEHVVALRKNGGSGALVDASKDVGARDEFSLAPIPKNTRVWKLNKDNSIGLDEKAEERKEISKMVAQDGKILSIDEYKKAGAEVDASGNLVLAVPKEQAL
jgi:hypothetical protein